jgi:hypothetical protein
MSCSLFPSFCISNGQTHITNDIWRKKPSFLKWSRDFLRILILREWVHQCPPRWGGVYCGSSCRDTGWRQGLKGGGCGWFSIDELGVSAKVILAMDSSIWVILEVAFQVVWSDWPPCCSAGQMRNATDCLCGSMSKVSVESAWACLCFIVSRTLAALFHTKELYISLNLDKPSGR